MQKDPCTLNPISPNGHILQHHNQPADIDTVRIQNISIATNMPHVALLYHTTPSQPLVTTNLSLIITFYFKNVV